MASSNKRWLIYGVALLALAAIVVYLRSGASSSKRAAATGPNSEPTTPSSSPPAKPPPKPRSSRSDAPPPTTGNSSPGDGSDIVVPENTFGENLPPPKLPPKGYKPPERKKRIPFTHAEKQQQRQQAMALMGRRIKRLEEQASKADTASARKLSIRIERMKQHRARVAEEYERAKREGPGKAGDAHGH